MKKITVLLALTVIIQQVQAQVATGRLEGLRDAWGTTIDYVGEIKNKQPNGLGVAIYTNDFTLRYSGYFVNGLYNGKGVLLFKDGTFLSGDWKNGKLNGKGAYLNKDGDFYVGYFTDGKKEGAGSFVYADKSILTGNLKNDTYEGRCIFISANGDNISDNIYSDGKKNGSGYQYELDSKTLYEGTWNNGDWVSSSTASYLSFLKSDNFYAEKTDNQILIGGIDKNNNNLLQDTGFFYDLNKNKRYFGSYNKGVLSDGITVKDSTLFFGKASDDGAQGQCAVYKIKKYFDQGTYKNDYLSGSNNLSIDLDNMTVYYGETGDDGTFSGNAWFTNKYNELYNGKYDEGKFTGNGYIVFSNGTTVKGVFKNGSPIVVISLTDGNGLTINQNPKTFTEGLSIITNEYSDDFQAFKADEASDEDYSYDDYYNADNSLITLPGSVGHNAILEDYDFYLMYNATMYKGSSYQDAAAKYNNLCKMLASASLHLKHSAAPVTLSGDIEPPTESETTRTKFSLNNYSVLSGYNVYAELKYEDDNYKVNLVAGDVVFDE